LVWKNITESCNLRTPAAPRAADAQNCSSAAAQLAQRKERASGTLILTVVSQSHLMLLANFIASLARLGLSAHLAIGCLDAATADLMRTRLGEQCLLPVYPSLPDTMGPFQRMGIGKHLLLFDLLGCNLKGVLLVDTDAVFTPNANRLFAWVASLSLGVDVFSSTSGLPKETSRKWDFSLNIGWTWFGADGRSRRWVQQSADHLLHACLVPHGERSPGVVPTAQVSFNLLLLEQNVTWFRSRGVAFGVCQGGAYAGMRVATLPKHTVERLDCTRERGAARLGKVLNVHCNARTHDKVRSIKAGSVWLLHGSIDDSVGLESIDKQVSSRTGSLATFVENMQHKDWRLKLSRFGLRVATPYHKSSVKNFTSVHIEHFGGAHQGSRPPGPEARPRPGFVPRARLLGRSRGRGAGRGRHGGGA
jgi:hypothetical protein